MDLSVIIVNYNVEHFLEQCLHSVIKASDGLKVETIVVDNASVDGSLAMLRKKFPQVDLIANQENVGFSKANNQGIEKSTGEFVLLLNPDTIVEEDTYSTCIQFMRERPDAGGLGVMMLDGNGRFLPESKRGLPTPSVAFHKIFGLSALFPRSERFNRYHLGHLEKDGTHEIEILSGAFMMMRKKALDEVGLLDEDFFMYGEDIDLSYRLTEGGYKNYYTADTRIIHYKGESTKKSSVNYVFVFYNAMIIFARKHFSDQHARTFSFFINLAIYFRAGLAIFTRAMKSLFIPLLDVLVIAGTLFTVKEIYQHYSGIEFPSLYTQVAFPIYALIWAVAKALNGSYIPPFRWKKILFGMVSGTAAILIIYSLLPDTYRFSRAMILLGAGASFISLLLFRFFLGLISPIHALDRKTTFNYALVGTEGEIERVENLMKRAGSDAHMTIKVHPQRHDIPDFAGSLDQLKEIIAVFNIDEVIFCASDIGTTQILDHMTALEGKRVKYRIVPPESLFIIGSDSSDTAGGVLAFEMNSVAERENRFYKRMFDLISSVLALICSPLLLFIQRKPLGLFSNLFSVLIGNKTFVGYDERGDISTLPNLRPPVLSVAQGKSEDPKLIHQTNVLYSKDYKVSNDLNILLDGLRHLGD